MKNVLTVSVFSLVCLSSLPVYAAGYQLNEYSVTGLGRSFAGAGVVGDDYSALAYNPAGMTLVKKSGLQGALTVAEVAADVQKKETRETTDMDFGVTLPSLMGQYNVNDRLFLGLGVYVPFGLSTKYKKDSFVADKARKSFLEVIDTNMSAAYKLTSKLSLGASFIIRYISGDMTNNIAASSGGGESRFKLDGYTGTGILGMMYEFDENTRLGISYKLKSVQRVKGDHTVKGSLVPGFNGIYSDGKASPDLPASILVSSYHKPFEKVAFTASVRWTEWHDSFKEFDMNSSFTKAAGIKPVDYNWKNTWTIALGGEYYLNDNWTLRIGTAFDQSPADDDRRRTHRIPDSDRIWVSGGFSYITENYQVDVGYAHLFMKTSYIRDSLNGDYNAKYNAHSNMYGVNFQYKF